MRKDGPKYEKSWLPSRREGSREASGRGGGRGAGNGTVKAARRERVVAFGGREEEIAGVIVARGDKIM